VEANDIEILNDIVPLQPKHDPPMTNILVLLYSGD
jgi:hypothetical protein